MGSLSERSLSPELEENGASDDILKTLESEAIVDNDLLTRPQKRKRRQTDDESSDDNKSSDDESVEPAESDADVDTEEEKKVQKRKRRQSEKQKRRQTDEDGSDDESVEPAESDADMDTEGGKKVQKRKRRQTDNKSDDEAVEMDGSEPVVVVDNGKLKKVQKRKRRQTDNDSREFIPFDAAMVETEYFKTKHGTKIKTGSPQIVGATITWAGVPISLREIYHQEPPEPEEVEVDTDLLKRLNGKEGGKFLWTCIPAKRDPDKYRHLYCFYDQTEKYFHYIPGDLLTAKFFYQTGGGFPPAKKCPEGNRMMIGDVSVQVIPWNKLGSGQQNKLAASTVVRNTKKLAANSRKNGSGRQALKAAIASSEAMPIKTTDEMKQQLSTMRGSAVMDPRLAAASTPRAPTPGWKGDHPTIQQVSDLGRYVFGKMEDMTIGEVRKALLMDEDSNPIEYFKENAAVLVFYYFRAAVETLPDHAAFMSLDG